MSVSRTILYSNFTRCRVCSAWDVFCIKDLQVFWFLVTLYNQRIAWLPISCTMIWIWRSKQNKKEDKPCFRISPIVLWYLYLSTSIPSQVFWVNALIQELVFFWNQCPICIADKVYHFGRDLHGGNTWISKSNNVFYIRVMGCANKANTWWLTRSKKASPYSLNPRQWESTFLTTLVMQMDESRMETSSLVAMVGSQLITDMCLKVTWNYV